MFQCLFDGYIYMILLFFFFFKQKTAYEMRISDWSSDVCSSDLVAGLAYAMFAGGRTLAGAVLLGLGAVLAVITAPGVAQTAGTALSPEQEIGRASCRERVCQYV